MRGNNGGIIDGIWREDWTYLHLSVHIHAHGIDWLYIVIVSSLKFLFHKIIIKQWTGWTIHCLWHNRPSNWDLTSKSFDKQHQWFFLVSKICHQTVIIMSICTKDKNSRQTRKNISQIECSCGKSLLDQIIPERFSISKSVAASRAQVVQNSFYPARHCRPSLHSNFSALKTDKAGKFIFSIGEIGGDFRRRAAVAIVALVPLIWSFDSETLSSCGRPPKPTSPPPTHFQSPKPQSQIFNKA